MEVDQYCEIVCLSGLVLPEESPHRRNHLLAPAQRTPEYHDKYDRHTLFYDCVRLAGRDEVLFTAPRFLNLWPLFREGLREAGRPVHLLHRQTFPKFELVHLRAPQGPLSLVIDGAELPVTPRAALAPRFAGLNAVMTMNRNNPIEWIFDWLTYHVRAHGLQAAVIHDNGSTDYDLRELSDRMARVPGLTRCAILSAPYPYGTGIRRNLNPVSPKFLQSALMNLARVETFSQARAVLNADIDELVQGPGGLSLFDAARASWHGTLNIGGEFVFPAPNGPWPAAQRAHVFRSVPPRISTRKWAARPNGLLSRLGWYVHQVGGDLFKLVPESRDFRLVHCSASRLDGSRANGAGGPGKLRHDPALQDMMDRVFVD